MFGAVRPRLAFSPVQEELARAGDTLGVVVLGTRGACRAHATVRTRAPLRTTAHRVLAPGAWTGLNFALFVAVRVRFTRKVVHKIIGRA